MGQPLKCLLQNALEKCTVEKCADIQARYAAGVWDNVILGNQGAIKRALHQQYDAVKSLAVRLE